MHKTVAILFLSIALLAGKAQAPAGNAAQPPSIQHGKQIFMQRCMQCHSVNKDQVLLGPSLFGVMTTSPHKKTAAQIRVLLRDGKGKMPPWKDILTPDDVDNILVYLHTL
jgi:mono/diheme cytochrome c family protein